VSATEERFPRAGRWAKGYQPAEVDAFVDGLETRFAAAESGLGEPPAPEEIRRVGFTLVRGGYDIVPVDAALDALEERAVAVDPHRTQAAPPDAAQVLRPAAERAPGERFGRAGRLRRGYDADAVDDFCDRLVRSLLGAQGAPTLGVDDVRGAVFVERLRGYDEDEVDAFLDEVVDLLLRSGRLGTR
jgi:DivIVA domain-containing protein